MKRKKLGLDLLTLSLVVFIFASNLSPALAEPAAKIPSEESLEEKKGKDKKDDTLMKEVVVTAETEKKDSPFLPDVQGTKINAGKKTTNIELQELPPISNNNFRQAFVKTPGLLVSEESTPLFSVGYRGLDPHRGQYTQVMKDGFPIHADMFGYPEAYYVPPLQTIEEIEFIRGGAALMYGPQPGGALNFVTKKPDLDTPLRTYSENVFGSDNYFSTYEAATGTVGPLGYYAYFHERQGDGFRLTNSDFEVISSGFKATVNQTGDSRLTLTYDEFHEEHGEPGGLSLTSTTNPTYEQDRNFSTREHDRFRLERYYTTLTYEKEFSEDTQFDFRTYGGRYRRYSKRQRTGGNAFGNIPSGPGTNMYTNDIEEQDFYNIGFEPRLRHDYDWLGETHTFTIGTHTFFSHSPREDQRSATPFADTGILRKSANRNTQYLSVFMENLFRIGKLSVTPGIRWENIWQHIREKYNLDKTITPLANEKEFDSVPLLGLGLVYEIVKGVEAYSNLSSAYRPKIFTQAVPTGTNQIVNEDLNEGFARQYDFGFRGEPVTFFNWDVSYFILDFKDQIGTVGNTVQNVGDAWHQGIELASEVDLVGALDFFRNTEWVKKFGSVSPFLAVTFLDAEFDQGPNKGKSPQYTPDYNLRFGINSDFFNRIKLSLLSTFVDEHYADDALTPNRIIPSYKVWDLTSEVVLLRNVVNAFDLSIFGGVNNLFDENYYARIRSDGIDPAYGRNIYGGFKISLGLPGDIKKTESSVAGTRGYGV